MAAPQCLITTINNIFQQCGYDGSINDRTVFREPRLSSRSHGKCDLCFPLICHGTSTAYIPAERLFPEHGSFRIKVDVAKVQLELPRISKSWPLPVKSCSLSSTSLCCELDRGKSFLNGIQSLLAGNEGHKLSLGNGQAVFISKDVTIDKDRADLTYLRAALAFQSLCNIYQYLGYTVLTDESSEKNLEERRFHLCHKSQCAGRNPRFSLIQCGAVLDISTGVKAVSIEVKDYYKNKQWMFEKMAQGRHNARGSIEHSVFLSEAEVTAELLSVKLHETVSISTSDDSDVIGKSKGASFLLYNHCRLSSIRKKYEQQVQSGLYPNFPQIEEVDFNLLTQNEEWEMLLLALQFPYWLINCISPKGKISLHPVFIGLDKLTRIFSVYYRRVRILTEPRTHLLPVMHARLFLLLCVEKISDTGLLIFGMKSLDYM